MPLWVVRVALVVGVVGAVAASVTSASWTARLTRGNTTWIMHLGRHPIWQPPAAPDYGAFRRHFDRSDDFPPPDGGWAIGVSYDPADVALTAVVYAWPVACVCGVAYLWIRGRRRDVVLHCALSAALGVLLAALACFALWCVTGGWGPPLPAFFGFLGVAGGLAWGIASFPKSVRPVREP